MLQNKTKRYGKKKHGSEINARILKRCEKNSARNQCLFTAVKSNFALGFSACVCLFTLEIRKAPEVVGGEKKNQTLEVLAFASRVIPRVTWRTQRHSRRVNETGDNFVVGTLSL